VRLRFHDRPHAIFDAPSRATRAPETRFSRMSPSQLDAFIAAGRAACSRLAREESTTGLVIHADFSEHAKRIRKVNEANAKFWEARK